MTHITAATIFPVLLVVETFDRYFVLIVMGAILAGDGGVET
jgi:hypothetical protein